MLPIHHIERVLEIDFEKSHSGPLVQVESITKRMGHYLYPSFASHAVILASEGPADSLLTRKAETFGSDLRKPAGEPQLPISQGLSIPHLPQRELGSLGLNPTQTDSHILPTVSQS